MKRLFSFFGALCLFQKMVVDGDGAGGDGSYYDDIDIDDVGNGNGDDAGDSGKSNPNDTKTPPTQDDLAKKVQDLEAKTKEQEEFINNKKSEEAISTAIADIKARHSDFDDKKVYEHLKELNKTDPEKANRLNNPLGWELVWHEIKPKTVHNDNFSRGRNTGGANRDDEVFDLVKSGSATIEDEFDVVGKFL